MNTSSVNLISIFSWDNPDAGPAPPCDIMPIAEETGLIVQIGQWVLKQAYGQTN